MEGLSEDSGCDEGNSRSKTEAPISPLMVRLLFLFS